MELEEDQRLLLEFQKEKPQQLEERLWREEEEKEEGEEEEKEDEEEEGEEEEEEEEKEEEEEEEEEEEVCQLYQQKEKSLRSVSFLWRGLGSEGYPLGCPQPHKVAPRNLTQKLELVLH
jgi:hypothetical protein